ncbi:MAG: Rieske (2Fe-2S) protein [Planctomycetota bacterium]|nr:MAG: Rieske (2Fe-2S) protein [Planctomycetota bacterium]
MSDFVFAINADEISAGEAVMVKIGDKFYAICNDDGIFYAVDESCPHEGGHLSRGLVQDGCLVCPVHLWAWNLRTGKNSAGRPHLLLNTYPCQFRDGKVYVDVSGPIKPDEGMNFAGLGEES